MTMTWEGADAYADRAVALAVAAERARIVEALATIHRPYKFLKDRHAICRGCQQSLDSDGDCPTMAIAKGKA